ncbi:hypothetical protein Q604_UNBC05254G0001, partial [human gut metagenome]
MINPVIIEFSHNNYSKELYINVS